jgi:hypothetical protein
MAQVPQNIIALDSPPALLMSRNWRIWLTHIVEYGNFSE